MEQRLSIYDFLPEAVVVDSGDYPTHEFPLGLVNGCDKVVCCDGAADRFLESGHIPWRIVGDCDSLSEYNLKKYSDIIRHFPDQETNDQTKAVRYLISKGMRKIAIVGATGKREDHSLGNISLLIEYLKQGVEARIYTDHGVFIPIFSTKEFHAEPGTQVSIFNFGAKGLKAEGLRYPIRDFDNWWQGTLNETTSPYFTIHCTGYLLLYLAYERGKR